MSNQNVETPWCLIDSIEKIVGKRFVYDMAASCYNNKAGIFFTEKQNSLSFDWPTGGLCWVNPPFKDLVKWFKKYEQQSLLGCQIIAISPLSSDKYTSYAWTHNLVCPIIGRVWKKEIKSCMLTFWNVPKVNLLHRIIENYYEFKAHQ